MKRAIKIVPDIYILIETDCQGMGGIPGTGVMPKNHLGKPFSK